MGNDSLHQFSSPRIFLGNQNRPSWPNKINDFPAGWVCFYSVLGIAVGTGNIWRFPRIAATNAGDEGAGAFLLAWFIFLLVWSVPLIIAEYALGRKGRMGVVGTIAKIAGEKFTWMGGFIAFVATAIMFYYSVVAGWCIYYFSQMVINPLPISVETSTAVWEGFSGIEPTSGFPCACHGSGGSDCAQGSKINRTGE